MARIFFVFLLTCALVLGNETQFKLKQVLMFSRHNLRYPMLATLRTYLPNVWPTLNETLAATLSPKGRILEEIMAGYVSQWLASENFINGCPMSEDVLIYANTKERTRTTGKIFAGTAFRNCNITAKHNKHVELFDPIFFPTIRNRSNEFLKQANKEMQEHLLNIDISDSYKELNTILDIKNSEICIKNKICDLSKEKTRLINEINEEPNVKGPLEFGNSIVDAFLMGFYEGIPLSELASGKISDDSRWRSLVKILRQNLNVRFNLTAARDITGPLLRVISDVFKKERPKFTVLVGHDSNIMPLLRAFDFKHFELPDTFDLFPVGGKIVFQKWTDDIKDYLKVEYFYQTPLQLRFAEELSLENPPKKFTLELKNCQIDDRGFCPWEDFMKILQYISN